MMFNVCSFRRTRMKLSTGKKKVLFALVLSTSVLLLLLNSERFNFWCKSVCVKPATPGASAPATPGACAPATPGACAPATPGASAPATPGASAGCSFTYLSPGNTAEGRRLVDSITWPETLPLPKPFSLALTSSAANSTFSIVPRAGGWHVGEELEVTIHMKDYEGNPKRKGGDFLVSRLHNRQLGAGVVGRVQDHLNGTFSARFPLLWNGSATVEVVLVHPSESITVLRRVTEVQPDLVSFGSDFVSGAVKETTLCNVCLDPHKAAVCNFSDIHTGEQWFCFKPKALDCDTRVSHFKASVSPKTTQQEASLFQPRRNLKVSLPALGLKTIEVSPAPGFVQGLKYDSNEVSPGPAGYYFNDLWRPLGGAAVRHFSSGSAITSCLKGKQLHLFGDSTIRQFYEYLKKTLPSLHSFEKDGSAQCGPKMAVDYTNDIAVTFRCHGPPLRAFPLPESQLRYVANELDRVAGGPNTVVGISVWAHFAHFPLEVYYQRLVSIRQAVERLQKRARGTRVFVRTGNMKGLDLVVSLSNSDWFSLQQDKLLRAVFRHSGVFLVEAWEMVQAHYLPHNLHPQPHILRQMVEEVLSHTCPGR